MLFQKMRAAWPDSNAKIHMSDSRYELLSFNRVIRAGLDARRQWVWDLWDCDDDVSATLARMRVWQQKDHALPFAVGRLRGIVSNGAVHDLVWCMDSESGTIRLWDATYAFEPKLSAVKPYLITDF